MTITNQLPEASPSQNQIFNPLDPQTSELHINLSNGYACDELISIIIVHKDTPGYLNLCLQSIELTSVNNNYEVIIVDNASESPDTHDLLNKLESDNLKIIRNDKNLWWSKAANIGARAADKNSKYLLFMHADVVVLNPNWLDLYTGIAEGSDSGLVGPFGVNYTIDGQQRTGIHESCLLTTRECWNDIGPFNEALPQVGSPFIYTVLAIKNKHNPRQAQASGYVHHFNIFNIDINEYGRFLEHARKELPTQMKKSGIG